MTLVGEDLELFPQSSGSTQDMDVLQCDIHASEQVKDSSLNLVRAMSLACIMRSGNSMH